MVIRFFLFILIIALAVYLLFRFCAPLLFGKAKFGKGLYDKYAYDEEELANKKIAYLKRDKTNVNQKYEEFKKTKRRKRKNGK